MQPSRKPSSASLARTLTLIPAAALIITNVVGTGVFVKARVMTCNVGTPWMVLLAYAAAGLFTLAGALAIAELSAMMPRSGGQYNFIGAAFGRVWAFLYGWMETLLDGAASVAAVAMVFVIFLNDLMAGALSPSQVQLVTAATIILVILLNLATVHFNGLLASLVTLMKILLVAGIGISAFLLSDGTWANFAGSGSTGSCAGVEPGSRLGLVGFGAAIVSALWAYNGWADLSYVAEEVRDPARTLPRATISASLLIILLYLLINAGYFYALGAPAIANSPQESSVAGLVVTRLFGAAGAAALTVGLMVSTFGALHSTALTVARIPYAMGRDGLLPGALGKVTERTRVPANAILVLGTCAIAFAFSGTFDILTDLIVFALLFFNGLGVASVYVLRRKLPELPRPYRAWGYPYVPAIFLAASAYLMINTLLTTPWRALTGVAIVLAGLPVYFFFARRLPQTVEALSPAE